MTNEYYMELHKQIDNDTTFLFLWIGICTIFLLVGVATRKKK